MWRKRAGSIKKGIFAGIILLSGILFFPIGGRAVCVHYETAKTALYTESYHRIAMDFVQGSPLEAETEDGVDPSNGKLTLLREDLHMQGMAGMDFSLTRYYDSKKANIGKAIAEEKKDFEMDTVRIAFPVSGNKKHEIVVNTAIYKKHANALKDMFVSYEKSGDGKYTTEAETQQTKLISGNPYNVYGISTGWAFDFPWIETKTIGSDTDEIPTYLHYGSLGTMRIATDNKNAITGFENYAYQDIKLEDFNQTTDGVACRYLLRDKRGLRTYFNSDGVVVMQKDNHDNTIRFTYRNKIYFDTITDSVGRKVKFSYKESQHGLLLLQNVKVEGQKVAGGVSKKTITYNSSETSYRSIRGDQLYGSRLNSAVVEGTKETYTYQTVESLVNTAGAGVASQRAMTNESYLIQGAEEEGCIRRYEYRAGAIRSASSDAKQERDVVTQHYYVTREYDQSRKNAKKKANGFKYDYFQKQTDRKNNTKLVSYEDLDDEKHEMQTYGTDKLQCMTLVSTYNPNKKQKAKKFADYVYTKEDINISTLQLKKKPKKSTMVYVYDTNRLPLEVTTEGKKKTKTEYSYDRDGAGSLIMYKTLKNYGTKRTGNPQTTKEGYTYDSYRNVLTSREPKAFKKKYKGKEKFFTTIYTYHGNGYPAADKGYVLNQKKTIETYENENTKCKEEYFLSTNQIDMGKMCESISRNNGAYCLLSVREIVYDKKGNVIKTKYYPDFGTEGAGNVIENKSQYNELGQMTKREISRTSEKNPQQNQSYVEQETVCDSFGNIMSVKDQKGLCSVYTYDEERNEVSTDVSAKGTIYETKLQSVQTEDNLKSMNLDMYGRCTVTISDDFGNVIISKDEKAGTWTEYDYVYGEEEEESSVESQLVEERTYSFEPEGEKVITNDNGDKEYNYNIKGRGKEILSGTRYIYDEDNEEIVTAEFSGGAIDADHCISWTMTKTEEEINEDGSSTLTFREKEINPKYYQQSIDESNYYNQFDTYMLSETVTETVTDEEGNEISVITTETVDESRKRDEITAIYDEFGNMICQTETVQVTEKGKKKNRSEIVSSYTYDYHGNVTRKEEKSRKDTNEPWETTTTKAVYDEHGRVVESYDPNGVIENYATKYIYDISGQLIKEMIPVNKEGDAITYQINTIEYDEAGNITAEESQYSGDVVQRTEYTYDIMDHLVQVKEMVDKKSSVYVQYMYDHEGNRIRQFSGLTKPLTLNLKEGKGDNGYTYMGHHYYVEVSGKAKRDSYSETKYNYNKRNELISYVDPEGNEESYGYDVYGNLVVVTDRNGNKIKQNYDFQNRLISEQAEEKETKKQTVHTYEYDEYGNAKKIDNREFTYNVLDGQMKTESIRGDKHKTIKKSYQYDSDGETTKFSVKADNKILLALEYEYDGGSNLKKVQQTDGNTNTVIASYRYNANGALLEENGQKVDTIYNYNPDGTLSKMVNDSPNGVLLSQYHADYQKNGQKTKEIEEVRGTDGIMKKRTSQYTYDRLGQLTKETHTGEEDISYAYDAHNNRRQMTTDNEIIAYRYNKNDELIRTDTLNRKTEKNQVTLYKQDKNGNQLATVKRKKIDKTKEEPQFDLNITLGDNRLNENVVNCYDSFNQNTNTLTKDYKVNFTYDAEGLRTSKSVKGKKTFYIWDGDRLVMELDAKGNVRKRYVWGQNLAYTDKGDGTKKQYYVYDMHGSVVQLVNEDDSIEKRYIYDAFGNEKEPDKKDDNPFRYCGEYYDKETDTLYLRARNYDAGTGRFLTEDTYTGEDEDIGSLNLYTYCKNDGVNMIDPTGHWGRHKEKGKKVFTHRFMTKKAYPQKTLQEQAIEGILKMLNFTVKEWQYKKILDGTLLPDFVNAENQKPYKTVYKGNYKQYKKYETEQLLGYSLKIQESEKNEKGKKNKKGKEISYVNAKITKSIFHGKNQKDVENLKGEAKVKVASADRNKEETRVKSLFLGCVLHSIQDYSAHSYVSDLDAFKAAEGRGVFTQKERAFHKDWVTYYRVKNKSGKDEAYEAQGKVHKKTKDNPYSQFVQNKKGKWYWKKRNGTKKNERYKDAFTKTKSYLKETIRIIK